MAEIGLEHGAVGRAPPRRGVGDFLPSLSNDHRSDTPITSSIACSISRMPSPGPWPGGG